MRKIINFIVLVLFFGSVKGQELSCKVIVNADRVPNSNRMVFKNLQIALTDFINNTQWSNDSYSQGEKVECSMFITVSEYNPDSFKATIQVQSSRPVFNSAYSTTVLNHNDTDFEFSYQGFEKLFFNSNTYDSNLVSVVAFYAYIILGLDADTFTLRGGTEYFRMAEGIAKLAQQSNSKGWRQFDGSNQNRFSMISDLLSNLYLPFRETMYQYHLEGLDIMSDDPKQAKENIKSAIKNLIKIEKVRTNAFLIRVFFNSKADEILSIFTGGPKIKIESLKDDLVRMSSWNSSKWSRIK